MNKKKYVAIITLLAIVLCACLSPVIFTKDKLSKDEVQALRNQYPFYDDIQDDLAFTNISPATKTKTIRDYIKINDTYAYCEVVGESLCEEVVVDNGVLGADNDKMIMIRYQYPVKIISDTEGIFQKGQEISFCYGLIYQDSSPSPKPGEKIILLISAGLGENEGVFYSDSLGYYSVTEKGYVMSAFREKGGFSYSGMKAENLMKELSKNEDELLYYSKLRKYEYELAYGSETFTDVETYKAKVKNELIPKNQEMVKSLKETASAEK